MIRSRIIGTGSYLPERVLSNTDLEKMVDTSDEWILTRTGIKERRINEGRKASDLGTEAARKALKGAGVEPQELDLIVVGTVTPDMIFPSTACFIQEKMGADRAVGFDISAACSGFIYALEVADRYIRSGGVDKALVVGVDIFSRIINWQDRATCILFGDGAGAVVLTKENGRRGILSTHTHSDGRYWNMLYAPLNGIDDLEEGDIRGLLNKKVSGPGVIERSVNKPGVKMQGNETFKVAVKMMEDASREALDENNLNVSDIDMVIPHQANARIIKAIAQRLSLPMDRVYMNIERYGNTSAASIPIAMDEAFRDGRIKDEDIVLLVAFGGGFTWASSLIRW